MRLLCAAAAMFMVSMLVAANAFAGNTLSLPAQLTGWMPFIGSGLAGIAFTLLALDPAIRETGRLFTDAFIELGKFITKYKEQLTDGAIAYDFAKVLLKLDRATEKLASIMLKVRANKLATWLSDIIDRDWYKDKIG
jgi:hypothetical protein